VEDAFQADRERTAELIGTHVGEGGRRVPSAGGVVDRDIEPAPLFDRGGDHALHRSRVGDIRRHGHRTATRVRDLLGHPRERVRVSGGEHDCGTGAGHRPGDLGPDPAACAGDDRPAAFEHSICLSHV
jgi:hypothetical protein